MNTTRAAAHYVGVLYFLLMISGIVGMFVLPDVFVEGDPAGTAAGITADEAAYRFNILFGLASGVLFVLVVGALYRLFRDVDPHLTALMVLLGAMGISVSLANLLIRFLPLVLMSEAGGPPALSEGQRDALVQTALLWHGAGSNLAIMFWGVWLFPFGLLVVRSGWFPRILGWLLLVAGFAYVATSTTDILWPEHREAVGRIMMPLYFGEVPIILWLLIRGARSPSLEPSRSVPA